MPRDVWTTGTGGGGEGKPPRGRMPPVPGRFGGVGRVLGDGENPLRWGVTLGRVAGVRVRVHWLFVVYAVAQVIFTLPRHQAGVVFVLPMLAALFVLVVLHELGHCFACRRVGGEADEIVVWPLGGLAWCRPPQTWRASLWTALGGPLVNLALAPLFLGALAWATGSWRAAVPNLVDPAASVVALESAFGAMPWWLIGLWSFSTANAVLLAFNVLVPMFPLDAGRVVQCLVWRRAGYERSVWVAAHVGLVAALGLGVLGLVLTDGQALLAVGVFGGVVCWMERRRLQFLGGVEPGLDVPMAPVVAPAAVVRHPAHVEPVEPDEDADQDELDRVLEKISRSGMGSLTPREKRVLKRATDRSRETEGPGAKTDQ